MKTVSIVIFGQLPCSINTCLLMGLVSKFVRRTQSSATPAHVLEGSPAGFSSVQRDIVTIAHFWTMGQVFRTIPELRLLYYHRKKLLLRRSDMTVTVAVRLHWQSCQLACLHGRAKRPNCREGPMLQIRVFRVHC